jgi:hypothetical protein
MIPSVKNLTAKKGAEALLDLQKSVYARNGAKKAAASKEAQEAAATKRTREGSK